MGRAEQEIDRRQAGARPGVIIGGRAARVASDDGTRHLPWQALCVDLDVKQNANYKLTAYIGG